MTEEYVAGLLFSDNHDSVALIHKTHGPGNVVGKWNAVGGKIRTGTERLRTEACLSVFQTESSGAAMRREFTEEAGVDTADWELFLVLRGPDRVVYFFRAFSSVDLFRVRTCSEEAVAVFRLGKLPELVPNLRWIIPMAAGHEDDYVRVHDVTEKETRIDRYREAVK